MDAGGGHAARRGDQPSVGGDYALALKGNQPALFDDVRRFLDDPKTPLSASAARPRVETRTASLSSDIGWLQDSTPGRACRRSARWRPRARSTAGPAPRAATIDVKLKGAG